jgi:hypothetical protein
MLSDVVWLVLIVSMANLGLTFWIGTKILKIEKQNSTESRANLELIDQSLKRLSHLHESYERANQPVRVVESGNQGEEQNETSKERRAIHLLRRGENPRAISRKLGISRSEMDLLMASERLGNGHRANIESV